MKQIMPMAVVAAAAFLLVWSCSSGDDGAQTGAPKRLYQTDCNNDDDCEATGICRFSGAMSACYPPCETACEGGTCEEGACIPSCGDAECPGALTCDTDFRCVAAAAFTPDAGAGDITTFNCSSSAQCGAGHVCIESPDGTVRECTVDCSVGTTMADCGARFRCVDDLGAAGMGCLAICEGGTVPECPVLNGEAATACTMGICQYVSAN